MRRRHGKPPASQDDVSRTVNLDRLRCQATIARAGPVAVRNPVVMELTAVNGAAVTAPTTPKPLPQNDVGAPS